VSDRQYSKAVRLAGAALHAGIDGDWTKASYYVQRINDECDPSGLCDAPIGWCDTQIEHATGGDFEFSDRFQAHTMEVGSGQLDRDDAPARVRWAYRLVLARARGDETEFRALLDDLNSFEDGAQRGSYVGALVESAALAMRTLPRGYARMGRSS
jgi:hypothetical protein